MRILSVGNFYNPSWDSSIPDEEHISEALEELGHEVSRQQREELQIPHGEYDFILISQWDGYSVVLTSNLRHFNCQIVYWSFDWQDQNQEWHNRLIEGSDLYLSKRIADSKYPNWQWLSQDFAPEFLDKYPKQRDDGLWNEPIKKDIDVLFTGSYLDWAKERNETIEAVGKKFNLVIHSVNAWPQGNEGPVMDGELPALYARAKVILSIDHTLEAGYWSDRNAQIMACGRRPLFRYIPLSEARFGDRVDYFYSVEDCIKKIESWEEKPTNAEGLFVTDRVKDLLTIVENYLENRTV